MINIYILQSNESPYDFVKKIAAEKYNNTEIAKTQKGKPYFKHIPDLFFSISHSGDLTAVAIGDCEVGIDIEKIRKPDLRIIKRFLKEEADYIIEKDSQCRFFEVWTKKEAYLKFKGTGISGGLDSVNVLNLQFEIMFYEDYIISAYYEK